MKHWKSLYIIDEKFRKNPLPYIYQSSMAAIFLGITFFFVWSINPVVVAGIGSTTFILFALPRNRANTPRNIIGGHTLAMLNHRHISFPIVSVLLVLSIAIIVQGGVRGEEHTVDDDGPADFTDIQSALDAAADGDVIHVMEGVYEQDLRINRSVSLIGVEDGGSRIITDNSETGISITADDVILRNFLIHNTVNIFGSFVLSFDSADNCTLENSSISSAIGMGVMIEESRNITLRNNSVNQSVALRTSDGNILTGNVLGAWVDISNKCNRNVIENNICESIITVMWNSDGNIIRNNTVVGIIISSSDGNRIIDNSLTEPISLYGSMNSTVQGNSFTSGGIIINPGDGGREVFESTTISSNNTINGDPIVYLVGESNHTVSEDAGQVILAYCQNITIAGISSNDSIGISLTESFDCIVQECMLTNSSDGIVVEGCVRTSILNTTLALGETDGINVRDSVDTLIQGNVLSGNARYGIRIISDELSWDTIKVCTISGSGKSGLSVSGKEISISRVELWNNIIGMDLEVHNSTLSFITIHNSSYAGIQLAGTHNDLNNLTVRSSGAGISLDLAVVNIISHSLFENNTNGIHLTIATSETTVQHCQFLKNTEYGIRTELPQFSEQGNVFRNNTFKANGKGSISSEPEYDNNGDNGFPGLPADENFCYYLVMIIVCGAGIVLLIMIRQPPRRPALSTSPRPLTSSSPPVASSSASPIPSPKPPTASIPPTPSPSSLSPSFSSPSHPSPSFSPPPHPSPSPFSSPPPTPNSASSFSPPPPPSPCREK